MIVGGTLTIAKTKYAIAKLNPTKTQTIEFNITTDSDYQIDAHFSSGKSVKGTKGYITRGIRNRDRLIIRDSSIFLEANSVEP